MDFATALAVEAWTLWSIGIILVIARMASRLMVFGSVKKLQPDDWIMFFTVFTFTGAVVSTMQVANNGSNYLPEGAAELLTPDEVISAIYGSKMTLVLEEFTLFTTWQIKACLLLFYSQLTSGLKQNMAVKILAGYCVLGFIVTQILYLGVWCRPIQQYWAVPVRDSQCASYSSHMITATVFNVSSDLMMLFIPIPVLMKAQLPLRRKLVLYGLFSLGIFVILAAILNRYYNFSVPYSPIFLNWYVGELSTAIFVANIPLCWPLFRRVFRAGTFNDQKSGQGGATPSAYHTQHRIGNGYGSSTKRNMLSGLGQRLPSTDEPNIGFSESEERVNLSEDWPRTKDQLPLSLMGNRVGHQTVVVHGGTGEDGSDLENEATPQDVGITKTVQVMQYTL